MVKKGNSIPMRIDHELAERIRKIAKEDNLSDPQASKKINDMLKKIKAGINKNDIIF